MQVTASMYVYRLKSLKATDQVYVGVTSDPKQRLKDHNEGKSIHTNKYKPGKCKSAFGLPMRLKPEPSKNV